jgi:hypothetical protein
VYLKVFRGEMDEHVHRGTDRSSERSIGKCRPGQDLISNFVVKEREHYQTTG